MSARRRKAAGHGGEFHVDERWMASYMDMVTVLMCLFIVLYAMSTVDQDKYTQLKNSLATGFGVTNSDTVDTAQGIVVPPDLVKQDGEGFSAADLATAEVKHLEELKNEIQQALQAAGTSADAQFTIDARGLTVGLIGTDAFFEGNSASLRPDAEATLRGISPVLAPLPNEITVEGHADPRGSPAPFASDWDLAAARSTAVLRYFVENGGIPGDRVSSISYGSSRPVAEGGPEDADKNRRVDIVIRTAVSQQVADLLPAAAAAGADGTTVPGAEGVPAAPAAPATSADTAAATTGGATGHRSTPAEPTAGDSAHSTSGGGH